MKKSLLALSVLALASTSTFAADQSDGDIHKNDYKWMQANLMYSVNELPGESDHDYLEMEFGGRSGIFDLYGYVDVFNLTSSADSDKADADSKIFIKFAPRMSIDAVTGKDLSFGPVQELYIASEIDWDGANGGVNQQKIGLGSDVMVPWLGKIGLNLYATYDSNLKDWDGYQVSTNWFKPFFFFENESFISYQGYIDYQFGVDDSFAALKTSSGGVMFNGIYWHSDRFAVGYGLKGYKDVYALKDDGLAGKTTGFSHYVAVTYKF
ncbi:MAG: nucleoside-specific channel-forming protein [Psychromonas sp.]|jgi:nucleoside-specific channel-forming protein|uniref:nucleoside-specific channel-forming Tsx family protein n=1 Tax=Psychromonas sp. TaxID=1884585 RepID=UPI0039E23668